MTPMAILLTKITATQNEVALSYLRLRGLYFLAVVFATTITVDKQEVFSCRRYDNIDYYFS